MKTEPLKAVLPTPTERYAQVKQARAKPIEPVLPHNQKPAPNNPKKAR